MILPYMAAVLLAIATAYSAVVSFRPQKENEVRSWIFPDGAARVSRIFVAIATLVLILGVGAWFHTDARNSTRPSSVFLLPEGYSGWVRVEFEVADEAALPVEGGQTLLKIPPAGLLKTSSPEQYGWARDKYAFYSNGGLQPIPDSGSGQLIWGKINGEHAGVSGKQKYEEFFVGSEQQFRDQAGLPKQYQDSQKTFPSPTVR